MSAVASGAACAHSAATIAVAASKNRSALPRAIARIIFIEAWPAVLHIANSSPAFCRLLNVIALLYYRSRTRQRYSGEKHVADALSQRYVGLRAEGAAMPCRKGSRLRGQASQPARRRPEAARIPRAQPERLRADPGARRLCRLRVDRRLRIHRRRVSRSAAEAGGRERSRAHARLHQVHRRGNLSRPPVPCRCRSPSIISTGPSSTT